MYEDKSNNRYRMFSSEDAYAIWKENPTDNQDLELFNFVRPSDYKLELTAIDSDGFNNKFIRYGDSESLGSRIAFRWSIYNDEGESSDSLSVTYTITNTSTGASNSFTRWYNRHDPDPNFSIYNYLQPGENSVTIECKGSTTGARNTKSFTISLLQINLTSTFKFYDKFYPDTPLQIPYVFERNNTQGTAKIYFRIDEGGTGKQIVRDVQQDGPAKITEIQQMLVQLSEGQHTLQIWTEAKYNDGNTTIQSNLLYYTFTVASSVVGSTGKFINIHKSFDSGDFPLSSLMLYATQYEAQQLRWGYYTDSLQTNTSISVTWKLLDGMDDQNPITLSTATANNQEQAPTLQFVPTIYTEEDHETFLCAYFGQTLLASIPIYIYKNTKVVVNETGFYQMKMSAYGRTNESNDKSTWTDESGNVSTTFTNIQWNTNSGWYNNSFRTAGQTESAIINFSPFDSFSFTTGKTIEIEFESEKVFQSSDKIIIIGNLQGARIEITPDTATLYDNSNNEVIHTNYKSNERIKLAFIINSVPEDVSMKTVESGLAYIVNNGILERAASASGKSFSTEGTIKIGGAASGVRVYNMRVYNYAISYTDAYNNYLYDSDNKATIADNNNILDAGGNISFDLCKNKLDTILISGDLSNILSGQSDKDTSTTNVTIERFCPSDSTKNFKINNVQIRKHGQSTLNYPITSMKFWLNKSKEGEVPLYETTSQADLLLNKNRYVMKSATDSGKPSIPANKFVLQANYADSSGVHNGGLERLMQNTWFNAQIDGEYKLRTEPQLFATSQVVHHDNENLNEDGWVEGYSNTRPGNVLWNSITNQEFPYDIRISPDSFPCAVFYYDEAGTKTRTFLGQYVFMDDKKSDYSYGERSIYSIPADPYCLTNTHKDDDSDANCVWDNGNVLRIEVVGSNVPYTSYMTHAGFTDVVSIEDETTHNVTQMYSWEQAFELIYPDEDDILKKDPNKYAAGSRFARKVQPFVDFHEWVVSTYNNQAKFEAEAAQHLDLYKMAAYYIFVLRFGLVDSLERNAQLKTYDGQHWHYEPWDMDIALGNKNDGGIAFNPPITRDTKLPGSLGTYAISGRSADSNGNIVTSNWLFDALEGWSYWVNVIVPEVANALYQAGLTYDNIINMFDNNYAAKWCELMYNQSGFFKYIESGNGDPTWLSWLQGSRMTHRHWWLSTSMDYYDAKWFCGEYRNHYIYIRANVANGDNQTIRITPTKSTYMTIYKDGMPWGPMQNVSDTNIFTHNMGQGYGQLQGGSQTKNPVTVYGANFMEEIDLTEIAHGLDGITLDGVYSEVLGSPLKRLSVGVDLTAGGPGYIGTLASLGCQIQGNANVFQNLQFLNIRGQQNQTDTNALIYNYDMSELTELQAMGSGLTTMYSSQSGNNFSNIELPDTVYTIWMNNSTWNNLSFWHTNVIDGSSAEFSQVYGISRDYDIEIGTFPTTVHNISLLGTSGSTVESIKMVKAWLASLVAANVDLSQYNLIMDKINWSEATVGNGNLLTFDELSYIAQLGNQTSLKGYLVLKDTGVDLTTAQLNSIKSWFGDTVFTKNSSGLIVDHKRQYISINLGGDVIIDGQGNATLIEGGRVSLNATRFSLAEDDATDYIWAIGPVGSNDSSGRYMGLTVIQAEDTIDNIAYITSTQSNYTINNPSSDGYDVKIYTSVSGQPYSTTLHVVATTYPTDMFIDYVNEGSIQLRAVPGYVELPNTYAQASFFTNSNQQYTARVRSTTYTIKRLSDNVTATTAMSGTQLSEFQDPYITLQTGTNGGIKIIADGMLSQDPQIYEISATTLFESGVTTVTSRKIVVQYDMEAIVQAIKVSVFDPINTTWEAQFGSPIGRNSMYKIDLMAITYTINFSVSGSELINLNTNNGDVLLRYLPNCTGLVFDGCTNLINTYLDSTDGQVKTGAFDFSEMAALTSLSIQNCTGLTADIDLTNNTEITQVDASGTTINVILPANSKVTKYELGTPTQIEITNPTVLQPSGVVVDSSLNISSLELVNIPNNKTFNMFGKIML